MFYDAIDLNWLLEFDFRTSSFNVLYNFIIEPNVGADCITDSKVTHVFHLEVVENFKYTV
jgi:hypothetical protein